MNTPISALSAIESHQPLDETFVQSSSELIQALFHHYNELAVKVATLESKVKDKQKQIKKVRDELATTKGKLAEARDTLAALESQQSPSAPEADSYDEPELTPFAENVTLSAVEDYLRNSCVTSEHVEVIFSMLNELMQGVRDSEYKNMKARVRNHRNRQVQKGVVIQHTDGVNIGKVANYESGSQHVSRQNVTEQPRLRGKQPKERYLRGPKKHRSTPSD